MSWWWVLPSVWHHKVFANRPWRFLSQLRKYTLLPMLIWMCGVQWSGIKLHKMWNDKWEGTLPEWHKLGECKRGRCLRWRLHRTVLGEQSRLHMHSMRHRMSYLYLKFKQLPVVPFWKLKAPLLAAWWIKMAGNIPESILQDIRLYVYKVHKRQMGKLEPNYWSGSYWSMSYDLSYRMCAVFRRHHIPLHWVRY
jgi:hypothetical protein